MSRVGLLTYVERGKGEERWTCQVDAKNPSLQREGGSMGGRIRGVLPLTFSRQGDAPTGYDTVGAQFRLYYIQDGVSTCDLEGLKQCWSNTW